MPQRVERPAVCDPLLAELRTLNPYRANVTVTAASGEPVCSAVPIPAGQHVSVSHQDYAERLLRTGEFTIGEPFRGPITGRWVVPLVFPRRDAADRLIGWVGSPLDAEPIGELLAKGIAGPGEVVNLVSPSGRIIARSTAAAKWTGAAIRDAVPNPLAVLKKCPQGRTALAPALRRICFNGRMAARRIREVEALGYEAMVLPSTSPAHAGMRFEDKLARWQGALRPGQASGTSAAASSSRWQMG